MLCEIVFEDVSEIKPLEILGRSLRREGKEYHIEVQKEKVVIRLKSTKNGNGKRFKRIVVSKEFAAHGEDTAVILDCQWREHHALRKNVWCVNASKIAEKFSCSKEFPLLGAIARAGILSLHSLIMEIYSDYEKMDAHKRALAVRRGFQGLKV